MGRKQNAGSLEMKKVSRIRETLLRAYRLGMEVGYNNHDEFAGWVAEERDEIFVIAETYGILSETRRAYEQGKLKGRNKSIQDMTQALAGVEKEEWAGKEVSEYHYSKIPKEKEKVEEGKSPPAQFLSFGGMLQLPENLKGYSIIKKKSVFEKEG